MDNKAQTGKQKLPQALQYEQRSSWLTRFTFRIGVVVFLSVACNTLAGTIIHEYDDNGAKLFLLLWLTVVAFFVTAIVEDYLLVQRNKQREIALAVLEETRKLQA